MLKGLKDQGKMHQDPKREHDEEKEPNRGAAGETHCSHWQLFVWATQITAWCRFQLTELQK